MNLQAKNPQTLLNGPTVQKKTLLRPFWCLPGLFLTGILSACGGGGGGSGGGPIVAPSYLADVPASAPAPKPVDCSAVLYGDSVMHGESTRGPLLRRPVDRLRQLLPGWRIEDRAVSGDSLTLAESRVMNDPRDGFRFVVLSFGINDMAHDWDVKAPLGRLVDYVKAEGRTAIVTGLSQTSDPRTDRYNADELATAIDHGAAFVSWGEREGATVDGTHPDQPTSDGLAEDLAAVLVRECR